MARMRAMVVLPMPRWPLKMYPWATRGPGSSAWSGYGDVVLADDVGEALGTVFAG
jgi:hypothetical protein